MFLRAMAFRDFLFTFKAAKNVKNNYINNNIFKNKIAKFDMFIEIVFILSNWINQKQIYMEIEYVFKNQKALILGFSFWKFEKKLLQPKFAQYFERNYKMKE